jgi:YVTN family beta-propeller protein
MVAARRLMRFTSSLILGPASLLLAGVGVAGATGYTVSEVTVGPNPATVAVDSASHRLYAANQGGDTVSVVDTATELVVDTIVVGSAPTGLAIDSSSNLLFVSNLNSASVSVINLGDDTVTATIDVGGAPSGIAVDPELGEVVVADHDTGLVSVIDETTDSVVNTVPLNGQTYSVAIDTGTHTAYVANATTDQIDVIDEGTWTVSTSVQVGDLPVGVLVVPSINRIFVTNYNSQTLSVINEADLSSVALVPLGVAPSGVVVDSDETTAYVAQQGGGVAAIDLGDDAVVDQIPVGQQPDGLAIDTNNVIYAADGGGSEVSVITGQAVAPTVTLSPKSQSVVTGGTMTFTAAATGAPAPTVSWQASVDGGSTWINLSGATTTTLTTGPLTAFENGWQVRAVFTNTAGSQPTSAATVTVTQAPPISAVVLPAANATLSGTAQVLDATASSGVTQVQYELSGGTLTDSVIAKGTPTLYGWLAEWNTTTVANGNYTLQSVASFSGGVTGTSPGITIMVDNPPPSTAVVYPASGAALDSTQTQYFDAVASSGVTAVTIDLTAPGDVSYTLTATPTYVGWIAVKPGGPIPPGSCGPIPVPVTIQSVASYAGGVSATSAPVSITENSYVSSPGGGC